MTWIDNAACVGEPSSTFYLGDGEHMRPGRFDRARDLCSACPVRQACLDDALELEKGWGSHGFRGGLTADERMKIIRRTTQYRKPTRKRVRAAKSKPEQKPAPPPKPPAPNARTPERYEAWRASPAYAMTLAAYEAITDHPDLALAARRRALLEAA